MRHPVQKKPIPAAGLLELRGNRNHPGVRSLETGGDNIVAAAGGVVNNRITESVAGA